jgi:hypothetical protein
MDIGSFYSENPVSSWKVVLGEDMHYHYGAGGPEPFKQTVYNLLEFLPPNSKILDCGCGWGGPGRLMLEEGHRVTGVTNSKTQADYITEFPVVYADLHEFQPEEDYDAAIFLESCFHLTDARKVFDNLVPRVKHILIADVVSPGKTLFNSAFGITLRPKEFLFGDLHKVGYVVQKSYERLDFYHPTLKYWRNNIAKLPPEEVYGHIARLKELCEFPDSDNSDIRQIFIHAKRR